MRWNVVIGGQLFSKSFLGYTTYKMSLVTKEGSLVAIGLSILPLIILSATGKAAASLARKGARPDRSRLRAHGLTLPFDRTLHAGKQNGRIFPKS